MTNFDYKNSKVTEPMNLKDCFHAACFVIVFFVLPAYLLAAA